MDFLVPIFFGTMIIGILFWRHSRNKRARRKLPDSEADGLIRRELGDTIETVEYNQHMIGNQFLANVLFVTSKEEISVENMKTAVLRLARRHPLLRVRTVNRGVELPAYFEEVKDFVLPFKVSENADWKEEYEKQIHTPYESDSLLWRVVYLPNVVPAHTGVFKYQYTFVFGFCHHNLDGTSYVKMFDEFLDDLESVHEGEDGEVQSQPLPPSVEDILPKDLHPTKGAAVFSALVEFILQFSLVKKLFLSGALPPNPWIEKFGAEIQQNSEAPEKTSFIPSKFSVEETRALLTLCKEHKTTVQAAVQTAAQVVIAELLHDGAVPEEYESSIGVTVNLRRVFPEQFTDNLHHVVSYFSPMQVPTRVTDKWRDDFWQLVQETGNRLRFDIKSQVVNSLKLSRVFNLFYKAGLSLTYLLRRSYGRFETVVVFTNLGNCNHLSDRKGMLKVMARYGSSGEHKCGSVFANNLMTVADQLFWTVTFYEHVTSRDTAQKYVDAVRQVISYVIKEKPRT